MISVKTINNQNAVINSVLGLDQNSNTIVNGRLTIQDMSGSLVITPSGIIAPTNTTLNNLTVNGTTNLKGPTWVSGNELRILNGTSNFNTTVFNQGFQVKDPANSNNFTQFYHSGPTMSIVPWNSNSKLRVNTCGAVAGTASNNLLLVNANHSQLQGTTGGIDCLNDTVNLFSSTTTPTMTISPFF